MGQTSGLLTFFKNMATVNTAKRWWKKSTWNPMVNQQKLTSIHMEIHLTAAAAAVEPLNNESDPRVRP